MRVPILIAAITFLLPACACGQAAPAAATAAADNLAIRNLLDQYAKAVDTVDLKVLAEIWSHSPDVSSIYPLGEEHGFDAIEQNVFEKVMGGMFSARDLKTHDVMIYVNGNSAWSQSHWDFTPHCARTGQRSRRTASRPGSTAKKREVASRPRALFRGSSSSEIDRSPRHPPSPADPRSSYGK